MPSILDIVTLIDAVVLNCVLGNRRDFAKGWTRVWSDHWSAKTVWMAGHTATEVLFNPTFKEILLYDSFEKSLDGMELETVVLLGTRQWSMVTPPLQ